MRFLGWLVLIVVLLGGVGWFLVGDLDHTQMTSDVHMYSGIGGNVGVLVTSEGAVVVDTMTFARQGGVIRAEVARLTDKPIVAVLNTHYHIDHTHGNPAFPVGTKVIATAKTLEHLRTRDADYWRDHPAVDLLPNETFDSGTKEIKVGGKTVRSYALGRGHTDGDMVVLFVEDRVIHTGDLVSNGYYPNIDLEAGGSVKLWASTLDKVLALPFDTVIPGHGPATSRRTVERYRDLMASVWTQTTTIRKRGGGLVDALKLVDVEQFGLKPLLLLPTINRNFLVRRTWEEASAEKGGA